MQNFHHPLRLTGNIADLPYGLTLESECDNRRQSKDIKSVSPRGSKLVLLADPLDQRVDQERQDVDQNQRFDSLFRLQKDRPNLQIVLQRPEPALDLMT